MIKRIACLLSVTFILILSACGNNSSGNGAADNGIVAEEELVIKASNYAFDQQEYHLKKGVPVNIIFENESGNHGILAPELKLQLGGKNKSKVIIPEEEGTFDMTCSIMCGAGHSKMSAKIIVEP